MTEFERSLLRKIMDYEANETAENTEKTIRSFYEEDDTEHTKITDYLKSINDALWRILGEIEKG